jgi:hypothetical protein
LVARSSRYHIEHIVRELVPGGEFEGDKYIFERDGPPQSLQRFDMQNGGWVDLVANANGRDVISFIARVRSLSDRKRRN